MGLANIRLRMAEPQPVPPTDTSPEQLRPFTQEEVLNWDYFPENSF